MNNSFTCVCCFGVIFEAKSEGEKEHLKLDAQQLGGPWAWLLRGSRPLLFFALSVFPWEKLTQQGYIFTRKAREKWLLWLV